MREALHEIDSNAYGFPEPGEIAGRRRDEREAAPIAASGKAKPAWWLLYAMLPLTVLAFGLADVVPATSGWRSVSELLATLAIFIGIALWLRANRLALTLATYGSGSESPQEMPLEDADPPSLHEIDE